MIKDLIIEEVTEEVYDMEKDFITEEAAVEEYDMEQDLTIKEVTEEEYDMEQDLTIKEVSEEEYNMVEEFNTYELNTPNMEEIDMIYTEIQNEVGGDDDISPDITIESLTEETAAEETTADETIVNIAVENVLPEKTAYILDPRCNLNLNYKEQIEVLTGSNSSNPDVLFYKNYQRCFAELASQGINRVIVTEIAIIESFYLNNQSLIDASLKIRFESLCDKIDIIIQDDVDVQFLEAKRNARWDKNLSEELAIKLR